MFPFPVRLSRPGLSGPYSLHFFICTRPDLQPLPESFPQVFIPNILGLSYPEKVSYFEERAGRFTPVFEDTVRSIRMGWTLSIFLLFAIAGNAQSKNPLPSAPTGPPRGLTTPAIAGDADENQDPLARELAKKANLERQAALKSETDKLLKLAMELKDSVDKSNANVLALDVMKKAEEIEKLARSVKDKMKGPK